MLLKWHCSEKGMQFESWKFMKKKKKKDGFQPTKNKTVFFP